MWKYMFPTKHRCMIKMGDYFYRVILQLMFRKEVRTMKKAEELRYKLKEIDELIRRHENSDGTCAFNADEVYIFLEAALSAILRKKQ